ncbi:MAG: hypothetical protein PHN57_03200 [Candidatus Omnitrophica bacterium]|nr:hypothetical protein [Candidatus Omnitrophota bacterium]
MMARDIKRILANYAPLEISSRPFARFAGRLGMNEKELLSLLRRAKKRGLIRRVAAVVDNRKLGFSENSLVAWQVGRENLYQALRRCKRLPCVSHCYLRRSYPHWPYNLYTMVHARSKKEFSVLLKRMSRAIKFQDYSVLRTVRELKKSPLNFGRVLL